MLRWLFCQGQWSKVYLSMDLIGNAFRYLSSFAEEQPVSYYTSKIGPDIEVCLINGRYQINAGNVNYSYGPLHDAFRRYFNFDPPPSGKEFPVLVLGFGGGSIASILRVEREMSNPITGVEIDSMMIKAGREHFNLDRIEGLDIIVMDALEFIRQCSEKYALIITDIYVDEFVPAVFEQKEFLEEVKRCLLPDGKLVFNKLVASTDTEFEKTALEKLFTEIFPNTRTFKVPVNKKMPNYMITGMI